MLFGGDVVLRLLSPQLHGNVVCVCVLLYFMFIHDFYFGVCILCLRMIYPALVAPPAGFSVHPTPVQMLWWQRMSAQHYYMQ